jgi:hypothetical protein
MRGTSLSPELQHALSTLPANQITVATRVGLQLTPNLEEHAWTQIAGALAQTANRYESSTETITAWLGDLLVNGPKRRRGQIKELANATSFSPATLRTAKMVCMRIPHTHRNSNLSWTHHVEVGRVFTDLHEISEWLRIASEEGLSKTELRRRIRITRCAKQPSAAQINQHPTEAFQVLREVRALDRVLLKQRKAWNTWSPALCKQALLEIATLTQFVSDLSFRAEGAFHHEHGRCTAA